MNRKLVEKLMREERLTAAETLELEQALEDGGARHLVSALPEEQPSLAWRSSLNERLFAMRPKPVRRSWWLAGAAAGAAAAVLAVMAVWQEVEPKPTPDTGLEQSIVATHTQTVAALELSPAGVVEPTRTLPEEEQPFQWTQEDLEAL